MFLCILEVSAGFSWDLSGPSSGGVPGIAPSPLNPPMPSPGTENYYGWPVKVEVGLDQENRMSAAV